MAQAKQAQVIITANASVAERVMQELEGAATRASNRMKSLADAGAQIKERMRQLAAANKQNTDEYKRLDEQLKQNNKDFKAAEKEFQAFNSRLRENVKDSKRVEEVMKQLATTATRDLRRAFQAAKRELEKMSEKDPRRQQLIQDMKKIQQQIDTNTGAIKKQQGAWGTLGTTMKNLFAYAGIFAGFNKLKGLLEDVIKLNLKFSDKIADIRKVSGLAMSDINQLATNLTKIDTRSSMESLMGLAYQGSKLGFGEYGIAGLESFTKAANQVNVALHEDLGDDAMVQLSKMTEVMGLIPKMGVEKAMLATGSAIFKLASTSTAAGGPIVEFSKRLMGLANQAGITAEELVAFGASADSMALAPEVAATAFNKLITAVQKQPNLIENALHMEPGTINNLFQAGQMTDAIVKIFEAMNQKGGMNALMHSGVFKDLGSDGARLVGVMATMANRVDMVQKALATSRKAFKDASAVTEEYNIQQETAAALTERANNLWNKAFVNPEGVDNVKELAQAWYDVSKSLTENKAAMTSIQILIVGLMKALQGLLMVLPGLLYAFGTRGLIWMFNALGTAFGAATIKANGFRAAWTAMSVAMKANWISLAIGLLIQLTVYLVSTSEKLKELLGIESEAEKKAEDMRKAYVESHNAAEQASKGIEKYKEALEDANMTQEQRTDLIKKFKNEYGDYLRYLGIEIKTVDDLRDAYADVVRVMQQKKLYEERENYKQSLTGERKTENRKVGVQIDEELKKLGINTDEYNFGNIQKISGYGAERIYTGIMEHYFGKNEGKDIEHWVSNATNRRSYKSLDGRKLLDLIRKYAEADQSIRADEREADKMWANDLKDFDNDKFESGKFKSHLNNYDALESAPDKDAARAAKKAEAEHKQAIRKDLQDAKQESDAIIAKIEEWYRLQETVVTGFAADGKWTQQQAEMVNRELEAAKNEALANARLAISGRDTQTWEQTKESLRVMMFDTGQWSQELFQQMMDVSMASIRQNLSRIDKEGGQYGITTSSLKDGLDKNAAGNRRKVQEIRNKTAKEVEKALLQYDYFEQAARAYEDRLTQLGLLTETAEQAADRIRKASGSLKAGNKTEEQMTADRSAARRQAGQQFLTQSAQQNYTVDYEDSASLNKWLLDFTGGKGTIGTGGMEFQFSGWAEAFKDQFNLWLKDSETYKADIQAFYLSLIDFDKQYFDSVKNYRQKMNENFQQRWDTSGRGQAYADASSQISLEGRRQKMMGTDQGTNFGERAGFLNIETDPEVQASMLRMTQLQEELEMFKMVNEQKKLEGAELLAFNEELAERQRAIDEAEMAMQESLMNHINEHISKLSEWTAPIEQFGADVGDAMGKAVFESESMTDGMQNALKSLVKSWGESTISIIKDLMMQQLKQKLIGKAMVKEEKKNQGAMTDTDEESGKERLNMTSVVEQGIAGITQQMGQQVLATKQTQDSAEMAQEGTKTTGTVMAGIAQMAAKVLGTLGPFGAPLIAVFTALLMGLLSAALGALGGGSGDKGGDTSAKKKVKLASGMLTYDKGNVQQTVGSQWRGKNGEYITDERRTIVGDDGRVYRAREQRSLPEGVSMVTEPIATRVNGQQALVGERGPEIVIGRRTTRAIQMNRPDLLRDLALIDRGITTRKVRTFDEGNISDMATAFAGQLPAPQPSADGQQGGGDAQRERDQAMLATLGVLSQTIGQLQQQLAAGIHAEMNMFGDNGAYKKFQQADKFYKKYGG